MTGDGIGHNRITSPRHEHDFRCGDIRACRQHSRGECRESHDIDWYHRFWIEAHLPVVGTKTCWDECRKTIPDTAVAQIQTCSTKNDTELHTIDVCVERDQASWIKKGESGED